MGSCPPKLVIGVAGPTGIGKTAVALQLAIKLGGELISCDSVQVYRHLNIGANKFRPGPNDPQQHLVDILNPWEDFTAGDFYVLCREAISDVLSRSKVPIVVGGTGFYFDWLINGRPTSPVVSEEHLCKIKTLLAEDTAWHQSLSRLRSVDPSYASALLPNDYYRLTKALAFHDQFGVPLSSFGREESSNHQSNGTEAGWQWRCVYLTTERQAIYRAIDRRCEQMVQDGLLLETVRLLRTDSVQKESSAGRSIGYSQAIEFVEALNSCNGTAAEKRKLFYDFLERFMSSTRQYARKQETWFANKFAPGQFVWIERSCSANDLSSTLSASLIESIEQFVISADPNPWIQASEQLKKHLRSQEAVSARRKTMLRYRPQLHIFHDPRSVDVAISAVLQGTDSIVNE